MSVTMVAAKEIAVRPKIKVHWLRMRSTLGSSRAPDSRTFMAPRRNRAGGSVVRGTISTMEGGIPCFVRVGRSPSRALRVRFSMTALPGTRADWQHDRHEMNLNCVHCGIPVSIVDLFTSSHKWCSGRDWLLARCPACHRRNWVAIGRSLDGLTQISIGVLDGAPGSSFVRKQTVQVPGLSIHRTEKSTALRLSREWTFPNSAVLFESVREMLVPDNFRSAQSTRKVRGKQDKRRKA